MKLYKESFRRLGRVGLTMLIVSVALTAIFCVQNCVYAAGDNSAAAVDGLFTFMPVLLYYVFAAGFGFALSGFSFLNKRADSDFYHSIPVRRRDLFLSVTAASMTWMAGTIVINALLSMVLYLTFGVPFLPAYVPMGILLFLVAGMLVYAAAAIGCSLTGTLLTNVVLGCLVLFLPRFLLFVVMRSQVEYTTLMSWMDLPRWLRPDMNAATGMIVMFSRNMYRATIMNWGTIAYSAMLAAVELAVGCLLFVRRPSELAERGAKSGALQTLYACLLAFGVMLLSLVPGRHNAALTMFTVVVLASALAVYVVYQLIVLRSAKKMFRSLPWFAAAAAVSIGLVFGVRAIDKAVLNTCPAPAEIQYVEFPGTDATLGSRSFSTLGLDGIHFDDADMKDYVASTLAMNIENASGAYGYYDSYFYNELSVIEPVVITTNNGQKIRRTILFANANALNELRGETPAFVDAVHALPEKPDIKRYASYYSLSATEIERLYDCYRSECYESGLVPYGGYRTRLTGEQGYTGYSIGEEQTYGNFGVGGYIGTERFSNFFDISLRTPKTASLWMMLSNEKAGGIDLAELKNAYDRVASSGNENDYWNFNMTVTNVPMKSGTLQQMYFGYNENGSSAAYTDEYSEAIKPFALACMDILQRGVLTDKAKGFNIAVNWNARCGSEVFNENAGTVYLAFSAEDQKMLTLLFKSWSAAESYNGYGARVAADEIDA